MAPLGSRFELSFGCTDSTGIGLIDTTTIHDAGTYSIVLNPAQGITGSATVQLTVVHDPNATITVNGPPVLATVSQAGARSLLTFPGTAGQSVTIGATGATPGVGGCGVVQLSDPNGSFIAFACTDSAGNGVIGPTTLPTPVSVGRVAPSINGAQGVRGRESRVT
jgi:hypothetical protein